MKALVFAAGLGTRLRPLTDHMPKALVPVGGKPMLERVILRLKEAGCNDITINIHHLGEQIIDFIHANQSFGIDIHFSDERGKLLDTGGGIRKARTFLDGGEPFLVHNADILTDVDLRALKSTSVRMSALCTKNGSPPSKNVRALRMPPPVSSNFPRSSLKCMSMPND